MKLKACVVCGTPCVGPRCPQHGGNRRTMTTSQRGYGWQHQQRRARTLAAGVIGECAICHQPLEPGQAIDLHHETPLVIDPHSVGTRLVHAVCNRGGGAESKRLKFEPDPSSRTRVLFPGGQL